MMNFQVTQLGLTFFGAGAFFTLLIILYSLKFMAGKPRLAEYYAYIVITLGALGGAVLAADYLTFLFFWGLLGAMLYLLVGISGAPAAAGAAKKTLMIVGGADFLMILGVGIIWLLTRSLQIGASPIPLAGVLPALAFFALLIGAFAKAGVIPFHSWIPDCAEVTPATVMALLPASLDKLLGIYFLIRTCFDIFRLEPNTGFSFFLLALGSLTIIVAVIGALLQHNFKKLLAFHAISQVGYMVVGIGTGLPIGVAGGLFHMFNNAIYKTCLFLCGGAIEHRTGTTELDKLGGLGRFMPLTFLAAAVAALSISGIPPFNGFFSKWMIYQGLIELSLVDRFWIVWLTAAMFGSALTLASFVKLIHAAFLGQWSDRTAGAREVEWPMWLPMLVLAALCVLFGVFAVALPLPYLVLPVVGELIVPGFWEPGPAAFLILIGLLAGGLVYLLLGVSRQAVVKKPFYGGYDLPESEIKVSGTDFYDTIKNWGPLKLIIVYADKGCFDLYGLARRGSLAVAGWLSRRHNGSLSTYLAWFFAGALIIALILMRQQ